MPTIAALVSFINSQPADREVKNWSWSTCIVGDFTVEVLKLDRSDDTDDVAEDLYKDQGASNLEFCARFYNVTLQQEPTFMDKLNFGNFKTYGEAQEYLKENA